MFCNQSLKAYSVLVYYYKQVEQIRGFIVWILVCNISYLVERQKIGNSKFETGNWKFEM